MKKFFYLLFLFFSLLSLFAQSNPIVQVDPVVNLSDEVWLDAVCDAATDNVLFTLKFLGQFEVMSDLFVGKETDPLENRELIDQETFDTSTLKTRAETEGYDNILFGSCAIEDGSYVITMNAYDLALDKITYSGSTVVESIFDTFEAVDKITYLTVEGFSGIHVTYGSLVLVPPNTGEPFSFTIDGITLPEGAYSVDRMPAGLHKLAVSQERPLGLYEAVHEIIVVEETENKINIYLPVITGEEITVFSQADRYLTLAFLGRRSGNVFAINNLTDLISASFFQIFREDFVSKYETWISNLNREIPLSDIDKNIHSNISFEKLSLWNSEKQKSVLNRTVSLSSKYWFLHLRGEDFRSEYIFVPDIGTITIDGKADDWADITTVFSDNISDIVKGYDGYEDGEGQDISWVGVATDTHRIYFALETVSKIYRNDRLYIMEVNADDFLNLRYDGSQKMFSGAMVRNANWNGANWFNTGDSLLRGGIDEIVEISFPLNKIDEWLQTSAGAVTLNFYIQRASSPYNEIDSFSIRCVLPSLYNAIRAE